jgi:hypothetical protein
MSCMYTKYQKGSRFMGHPEGYMTVCNFKLSSPPPAPSSICTCARSMSSCLSALSLLHGPVLRMFFHSPLIACNGRPVYILQCASKKIIINCEQWEEKEHILSYSIQFYIFSFYISLMYSLPFDFLFSFTLGFTPFRFSNCT